MTNETPKPTTRRKTTTRRKKAAAPTTPPAKPPSQVAAEAVVQEEIAIVQQPAMRKKELFDRVAERSGIKKAQAKTAIEAALAILGEALAEGRELNIPPMGKLRVRRMKKTGNGTILATRIRQPDATRSGADQEGQNTADVPLAPPED